MLIIEFYDDNSQNKLLHFPFLNDTTNKKHTRPHLSESLEILSRETSSQKSTENRERRSGSRFGQLSEKEEFCFVCVCFSTPLEGGKNFTTGPREMGIVME